MLELLLLGTKTTCGVGVCYVELGVEDPPAEKHASY
jgi:hypothetical protein